jgi:PKD repeat protein
MGCAEKTGLILLLVIMISACLVSGFERKAVELGSPDGFTCHPSINHFITATMAADFTADRTQGDAPFTVRFFDISYGEPEYWQWDFGDGNTSEDQYPVYTYLEPGKYDVSLKIGKGIKYETTYLTDTQSGEGLYSDYNNTGKGQLTDMSWSSTDRELDYITVAQAGSGTDQPYPYGFYPEPKNMVTMPSGLQGVVGSASFDATTITITPTTQKGYSDTLNINGIYRLSKSTPYNDAF